MSDKKVNELIDEMMQMAEAWQTYRSKHKDAPKIMRRAIEWQAREIIKLIDGDEADRFRALLAEMAK